MVFGGAGAHGFVRTPNSISMCTIPHTVRESVWLVAGIALGAAISAALATRYARASTASKGAQPRVLATPARVVEAPGLIIDEHVGNVANREAGVSVARVLVSAATSEPTQTPLFDEYLVVLRGETRVTVDGGDVLVATAGQTLHLPRGFTYTSSFPGPAEYIAVCLPGFAPALALRK